MLTHPFPGSEWQRNAQDCCQLPVLPVRVRLSLWPGKNNLNTPFWLGSTQFLRWLLVSTYSITTASFHGVFQYQSPYVIFFLLFPHWLVLALKFLCHRNELLARDLPLAFTHSSNETMETSYSIQSSFDYEFSSCPFVWYFLWHFLLALNTLKTLQLKIFAIKNCWCVLALLFDHLKNRRAVRICCLLK